MYAKSVGWDTWWHKDSSPRMMIRYPARLYSPWPARWPGPAPPLFSSPDRESSHPAREQWTVSPGTSGHWARQITRTPPCNAIMSSERPDNWLICSSPWPSLGTWSQWRRARESFSLELQHTVQFSKYAYKGQVYRVSSKTVYTCSLFVNCASHAGPIIKSSIYFFSWIKIDAKNGITLKNWFKDSWEILI